MEDQPRGPNFNRLIPLGVVFIVIVTVLMLLARDAIRELVVLPISYLIYVFRLIVRTTPQVFFWIAAVMILVLAAWRSLAGRPRKLALLPMHDDFELDSRDPVRGRASYWLVKAHLAARGESEYYARSFHTALGRLLLDVLAYRYRLVPNQVEDQLREGTINVPPEVREYALFALRRDDPYRDNRFTTWLRDIFDALVRAFRRLRSAAMNSGEAANSARVDPQVARILKFMEEELELEVLHDDANR